MERIGLALGGGGARGLAHIEFLKTLDEKNIKLSIIAGTSIGAIIGAFYASGISAEKIEEILNKIDITDKITKKEKPNHRRKLEKIFDEKISEIKEFYKKIDEIHKIIDISFFNNTSFLKGKGVVKFFEENLPVKTFEELKNPLKIVATDYWKNESVIFSSGELIPAIRASMSIPAIFEPIIIDDSVLVDGGITNNLPYDIIQNECDKVIAIDVSGCKTLPEKTKIPNFFDNVMNSFEILQASIIQYQMKLRKPDIYLKPKLEDVRILEFHKVNAIMESVAEDVEKFKQELDKL